jgi:SNF2 family DNA or RNA helicase
MAFAEHIYEVEIGQDDPRYPQPEKIAIPLKPHQSAAIHKAVVMETTGKVYYNVEVQNSSLARQQQRIHGQFHVNTNIGVMGDIVGFGKTFTALGIIASVPTRDIYVHRENIHNAFNHMHSGHFSATCERDVSAVDRMIHTTLVVVPRGPVFVQWERAISQHTTLKCLSLESLPCMRRKLPGAGTNAAEIKTFFEQFDIVLVKSTSIKTLLDFYAVPYQEQHPLSAWDRIMVDEAHDILSKIPLFSFKFLWLISATYQAILDRTYITRNQLSFATRDILNEERLKLCLVKGQKAFVKMSFDIPEPIEQYYLCAMQRELAALHQFLTPSVQERLNANDIAGAIKELGGSDETEHTVASLVTRELDREITNKERELSYITSLDIPADQREHRVQTTTAELERLREKKRLLVERVTALSSKTCPICYENYSNPIMLKCTHFFCGECLIGWMRSGTERMCPECRAPIESTQLIAIVDQKTGASTSEPAAPTPQRPKSKEDTLLDIIATKPDGKFLIFTAIDAGFWSLMTKLSRAGISFAEMKGTTSHMMRVLNDFKEGRMKVILLNTFYAGSGIDLSCATDVVLFHSMGIQRIQAVGRAQRQGRTDRLHIHNLCYPNEMNALQQE